MPALDKNFLRVAKCGKPVGLKGEVTLWPISNLDQRFVVDAQYRDQNGIEYRVEKIRPQKDYFVVKFFGVSDRDSAEKIVNTELFAEPISEDILEQGEYFHHQCLDKTLIDQDNIEHGVIVKVIESAASDLLETKSGALVPFRFITKIDENSVFVDVPDGLFEIVENKK